VGGKAGKDGGAVAGGEDAGFGGVHKTANFGTTGVEFVTEEFKIGEVDARRYVINITEEMGNTTKAIVTCVA